VPSRRQVLAGVSTVLTGVAGCSNVLRSDTRDGEGDTIEIIVVNETDEVAQVGVRIEGDRKALFSRVYRLEPEKTNESAGIETSPTEIYAFTPTGAAVTWEYTPDPDLNCEGQDIGITLTAGGTIESWYGC